MPINYYLIMRRILFDNVAITSLLGKFQGTTIPLICSGIIPETETALPALRYVQEAGTQTVPNQFRLFRIDCYATNSPNTNDAIDNSTLLAETVVEELNGKDHDIGVMVYCSILEPLVNPESKEVNTPVEVRLIKIGGA